MQAGCKLLAALLFTWALLPAQRAAAADDVEVGAAKPPTEKQAGQPTDALGDPLPPGAIFRFGTLRFRPPSTVRDIALAPDEATIVTIGDQLIAWDVETGKERWRVASHEFGFRSNGVSYGCRGLVFSADSSHFYTVGRQDEVNVWNTRSGKRERIPLGSPDQRRNTDNLRTASVDVTADGQSIALGSPAGLTVVSTRDSQAYEITNQPVAEQVAAGNRDRLKFGGPFSLGQFSPKGDLLAVVSSDTPSAIRLFDPATGKEQRRITLKARLVRMAFSPDGAQLAATERDNAVRMYDVASAKEIWSHVVELKDPTENYTSAIAYSPDGRLLAVCATDELIHLLDAANGNETAALAGHTWYPWAVTFTADSKILYSSGWDGAIRRWDVATGKQLPPPKGIRGSAVVTASPDGKWYAYQDDLGTIRLVDALTGAERRTLQLAKTRYGTLVFSQDCTHLASGGGRGEEIRVVVWNQATGEVERDWTWPRGKDPKSTIESLEFSPDGKRLAAAVFRQSKAYLWDLVANRSLGELEHPSIYGLSFSRDSKTLATAGWDRAIHFWNADTAEAGREYGFEAPPDGRLDGGDTRMYTVVYAPRGGLLATAHLDGKVRLWHADDMTLQHTFGIAGRFHFGSIAFSPDGLWLATGSSAGKLSLWDPLNGQLVHGVGEHQDGIYTVAFGRRGQTLISGGSDGVGYVWDLRPSGVPVERDLDGLWNDLVGEDSGVAYKAMWALTANPERAANMVAHKLRAAPGVIALRASASEKNGATEREGAPGALRWIAARRAVALLARLDVPQAANLLGELSNQAASAAVKQLAAESLTARERSPSQP